MAPSPPPDLKVLCRKTSPSRHDLPLLRELPLLQQHIVRCRDVLSSPQEHKPKDGGHNQSAQLVHQLRTSVTTLLTGRGRAARLAASVLVKALVDVGGREILKDAAPWVDGLLSILQKGDPFPSKESAVITLTRVYAAVQPYQTLAREIASKTLPAFIAACLQVIKPPASSGQAPNYPSGIAETICDAFSTLIPLYPTTFRTFNSQIRSAVRGWLSPTTSDECLVPCCLSRAARRLVIALHFVAPKSGGSEEWAKLVDQLLTELHATADQVLRAVDESWEGTSGYSRQRAVPEGDEPGGGSNANDGLPPWRGLSSGAERLTGLFIYLADCLRYPTSAPVVVPVGALMDAVSRVCLVARLSPKTQSWDQAVETNPAVSREEKEELWSVLPDIHISALGLLSALIHRFHHGIVPLVSEALDHIVRVFNSGIAYGRMRSLGYQLLDELLLLVGPTMSKSTVVMIEPLIAACCRDLQEDAGFLKPAPKPSAPSSSTSSSSSSKNNTKMNSIANADLFLKPQVAADEDIVPLDAHHRRAAGKLLVRLLASPPQHHLKPSLRGLLDKTAILTRSRDAMMSSVLNPYKDQRGRMYPSIIPHLSQQYPHDQGVEVLRSNLRTTTTNVIPGDGSVFSTFVEVEAEEAEDQEGEDLADTAEPPPPSAVQPTMRDILQPGSTVDLPVQSNPFESQTSPATRGVSEAGRTEAEAPSKRKLEEVEEAPVKRQFTQPAVAAAAPPPAMPPVPDEDDDSDVSVHLNMELDDDDDDDDQDEE